MKQRLAGRIAAAFAAVVLAVSILPGVMTGALPFNYKTDSKSVTVSSEAPKPTFKKYLTMPSDANVPPVTFNFSIAAGTAVPATEGKLRIKAGVVTTGTPQKPSVASVSFSSSDSDTKITTKESGDTTVTINTNQSYVKKDVSVDFTGVEFTEPGIYRYVITETTETSNNALGVTSSTDPIYLDVYVTDTEGQLSVNSYVFHSNIDAPSSTKTEAYQLDDKVDGIVNSYSTKNLTFSKAVDGNQASRDEYFKFTVTFNNATVGTKYNVDLTNAESTTAVTGENATTHSNPSSIEITSAVKSFEFWIQNGQSITIQGLAEGTKYTVSEDSATLTSEGYTASYKVNDAASATTSSTYSSDATTGITENTTIAFTNTRQGVVPTGIILSTTPYMIIGLIAVAGIIFLAMRRKRSAE